MCRSEQRHSQKSLSTTSSVCWDPRHTESSIQMQRDAERRTMSCNPSIQAASEPLVMHHGMARSERAVQQRKPCQKTVSNVFTANLSVCWSSSEECFLERPHVLICRRRNFSPRVLIEVDVLKRVRIEKKKNLHKQKPRRSETSNTAEVTLK